MVLNVIVWVALIASIPVGGFHPISATAASIGAILIAPCTTVVALESAARGHRVGDISAETSHLGFQSV